MDLLRLIVVHILIGTSVALGMVIVPTIAWLVQRMSSNVEPSGRSADWNSRIVQAHVGLTTRRSTSSSYAERS